MEIGLISDTHGLLRLEALKSLKGVSMILHAGDVGGPDILEMLRVIAPVYSVRGNTDTDEWGRRLPLFETVQAGPDWIYLHHGHIDSRMDFKAAGMKIVVSGHTHVPRIERRDGILHINPGSAGPRRGALPVSVARLTLRGEALDAKIVELEV